MENELTIKILSNSNGEKVSLENISVDAADALKIFIESLSNFAQSYNDTTDVKISLKDGCIETTLLYPAEKKEISEDIEEIIAGKSFETHRTKLLKNIQDKVKANGLEYDISLKKNNEQRDLTKIFLNKNFPIRRGKKIQLKFEILFLHGEIFEAGGKSKTNVHITVDDKDYKIDCTKAEATQMGSVYNKVNLSVLKKWRTESKIEYLLLENYLKEEDYKYFKDLHDKLLTKKTLERYDYLHDKVVEIVEDKNMHTNNLIKLLRLYNNQYSDNDRGILRTLLMSIKPILKINDEMIYYYNEVAKRFKYGSKSQKI